MATPTEREIRRAIIADMRSDPHALVVEELALTYYGARIDVSSINGSLCGFEIKTDSDTLARLPEQADAYSRVFDFVTIVVGTKHLRNVETAVPEWWGISCAQKEHDDVKIEVVRAAQCNPSPDPIAIASLLWKDELVTLYETYKLGKASRLSRKELISTIAGSLALTVLQDVVRDCVQRRINWRVAK